MSTTDATYRKEIRYDRETRDFAMYLDGELIGFARTYHEAEVALDQLVFELLSGDATATATELDAGSDVDAIAADTLVIRADAPAQLAAVVQADALLLEADAVLGEPGVCIVHGCQNPADDEFAPYCVAHAHAIMDELAAEDAAPRCAGFIPGICTNPADPATAPYCRQCAAGVDKTLVAAYVQKLMEDAGLACSYCGEPHTADACPLRKPLVVPAPTTCKNCGQAHSIQNCPELWHSLRLFA